MTLSDKINGFMMKNIAMRMMRKIDSEEAEVVKRKEKIATNSQIYLQKGLKY